MRSPSPTDVDRDSAGVVWKGKERYALKLIRVEEERSKQALSAAEAALRDAKERRRMWGLPEGTERDTALQRFAEADAQRAKKREQDEKKMACLKETIMKDEVEEIVKT